MRTDSPTPPTLLPKQSPREGNERATKDSLLNSELGVHFKECQGRSLLSNPVKTFLVTGLSSGNATRVGFGKSLTLSSLLHPNMWLMTEIEPREVFET